MNIRIKVISDDRMPRDCVALMDPDPLSVKPMRDPFTGELLPGQFTVSIKRPLAIIHNCAVEVEPT